MSFECGYEGCGRSFDSKQGLGQHESAAHEGDEPYKDEERMRELYLEQKLSSKEIAEKFDVSSTTIIDWLDRLNIQTRTPSYERPPNFRTNNLGYEEIRNEYQGERDSVLIHRLMAVAECGFDAVAGKDVHHENGIQWDNRPRNLSLMTRSEHVSEHHQQGMYDDHLEEVHQHRHDDGHFASFGGGSA
ncbi:HNH endonuclease [Halorientalis persicus]|uniref:HNH endonuclease n=1 Tax=Halorientalis persicus TaxID=1367881 RepID=A0A1H8S2S6_9EURY|nr:HNH endonuclease [Halorientalis persicus]SEO73001.1 HNH endonuclease [Halorientalis persicus]